MHINYNFIINTLRFASFASLSNYRRWMSIRTDQFSQIVVSNNDDKYNNKTKKQKKKKKHADVVVVASVVLFGNNVSCTKTSKLASTMYLFAPSYQYMQ